MEKTEGKKKNLIIDSENTIEIDCVIFSFERKNIKFLLIKRQDKEGHLELPNDLLKKGETLTSTAHNILRKYIGNDNFFVDQLRAFGYPSQSSSQEDIAIGYYALIKRDMGNLENHFLYPNIAWFGINEISGLNDKHQIILDYSLKELRKNICKSAIGFTLLPEKFTLLQVVHLYEEILGIEIDKSNFRRKLLQMNLVHNSNEKEQAVSHRAAKFYSLNLQNPELLPHIELNFNF